MVVRAQEIRDLDISLTLLLKLLSVGASGKDPLKVQRHIFNGEVQLRIGMGDYTASSKYLYFSLSKRKLVTVGKDWQVLLSECIDEKNKITEENQDIELACAYYV
jgi:hypothetical protein